MLSHEQLKKFEERLIAQAEKITSQIKNLEASRDFGSDVDHFEEETDEAEEFSNQLGIISVLKGRLEAIKSALEKIKKGNYGVCENCGGEIEMKLLEVDPESKLCQNCKKQKI